MYVAVKGGERAIDNAHAWLAEARRGDRAWRRGVVGEYLHETISILAHVPTPE